MERCGSWPWAVEFCCRRPDVADSYAKEIAEEAAVARVAVRVTATAVRLAGRFVVRSVSASTPTTAMDAEAAVVAPSCGKCCDECGVAASATSASIPCGGSGACSIAAPGAVRVAAARTGAKGSAIRPIATTPATVTAIGPAAADARVAITAADTRRAMFRRFPTARRSRMIPCWNPRRPPPQPRRGDGPRTQITIAKKRKILWGAERLAGDVPRVFFCLPSPLLEASANVIEGWAE